MENWKHDVVFITEMEESGSATGSESVKIPESCFQLNSCERPTTALHEMFSIFLIGVAELEP
jgi:hypothetical protein